MSALQIIWFILLGALLAGYVILDGYDLGVGFWHLISRSQAKRKAMRNAIAPFWDANEVWLITAGAAVFAAFPMVYATVFSGFYLALMLVIFALIFRAVSIEFVSHTSSIIVLRFWETMFGIGSALPALLFGVAMGNILQGLPLDASWNYTGSFFDLLNPYSLLIGITGFALFAMHGALFLNMRSTAAGMAEGKKTQIAISSYFMLIAFTIVGTLTTQPHITQRFVDNPVLFLLPLFLMLSLMAVAVFNGKEKHYYAFISSCISIIFLFATLATALFPYLVPALNSKGPSLTITNSSSSPLTLSIMLGVSIIGMSIVVFYTVWVRKVFRDKNVEY